MAQELYSVEQVAELLNLHVKTVRSYVREGRLKAVRIGKQYRISGEDLAAMTGRPAESFRPEPVRRERHVEVSSIVEIDAISPEAVHRLTNLLTGGAKHHGEDDQSLRVESIYNAERGRLKVILSGSMGTVRSLLGSITFLLEQI
jgi:excisionase family DNA binding protein